MFPMTVQWYELLKDEIEKPYFQNLCEFLEKEYQNKRIFPDKTRVFNALNHLPPDKVRVVIMGQDPYHEVGQAEGLAFSVPQGVDVPPSLQNIRKEIIREFGYTMDDFSGNGTLYNYVKQGVLLLNSVLTVEEGKANSHREKGWQEFTKKIIEKLNQNYSGIVFVAWGNNAKNVLKDVDRQKHLYLESAHPSPLSCTRFFGNNHFKTINEYLTAKGEPPIDWRF